MKYLFEEFREYENLWESAKSDSAITIKQGGKEYDLTKEDNFKASVDASVESAVKTFSAAKNIPEEERRAYADVKRIKAAEALLAELKNRKADARVIQRAEKYVAEVTKAYDDAEYSHITRRIINKYFN